MAITTRATVILKTLVAGGILAACFSVQSAMASQLLMTYKGTATSISDPGNIFGLAPGVTSASFADTFTFDLNNPGRVTTATYDELYGGSNFGTVTPLIDSALTINGHSVKMQYVNAGEVFYGLLNQGIAAQAIIFGPNANDYDNIVLLTVVPKNLDAPFSASGTGFGYFGTDATSGNLSPTSITATIVPASVPEPASWLMVLAGFAFLGFILRSARGQNDGAFPERNVGQ
jgi:hypothetical protein